MGYSVDHAKANFRDQIAPANYPSDAEAVRWWTTASARSALAESPLLGLCPVATRSLTFRGFGLLTRPLITRRQDVE